MRALLALALLFAGTAAAAEPAGKATLSEGEARALLQGLCEAPVLPGKRVMGGGTLTCNRPHAYPVTLSCALALREPTVGQPVAIYRGRFSQDEPQAVVFYAASCEPHANNGGGMLLLRDTPLGFALIRYVRGLVGMGCAVRQTSDRSDELYCFTSHVGQGELEQRFGPFHFTADGSATFEPWASAGNLDDFLEPMIDCARPGPLLHHLRSVATNEAGELVLEAAALDPRSRSGACDRFRRAEFSQHEQELRALSRTASAMAFLRPNERRYVRVLMRFQPPSPQPQIEVTIAPVPGDPGPTE